MGTSPPVRRTGAGELLVFLGVDRPAGRTRLLRAAPPRMIDAVDERGAEQDRADNLGDRQQRHALNRVEHWIPRVSEMKRWRLRKVPLTRFPDETSSARGALVAREIPWRNAMMDDRNDPNRPLNY